MKLISSNIFVLFLLLYVHFKRNIYRSQLHGCLVKSSESICIARYDVNIAPRVREPPPPPELSLQCFLFKMKKSMDTVYIVVFVHAYMDMCVYVCVAITYLLSSNNTFPKEIMKIMKVYGERTKLVCFYTCSHGSL